MIEGEVELKLGCGNLIVRYRTSPDTQRRVYGVRIAVLQPKFDDNLHLRYDVNGVILQSINLNDLILAVGQHVPLGWRITAKRSVRGSIMNFIYDGDDECGAEVSGIWANEPVTSIIVQSPMVQQRLNTTVSSDDSCPSIC